MEQFEIVQVFTGGREHDRLTGHGRYRKRGTTAGVAVELGEHDTREVDASSNAIAVLTASWPIIESMTKRTSLG